MKALVLLSSILLLLVQTFSFTHAQSPEIHLDPVGEDFEITAHATMRGIGETRSTDGTWDIYSTPDGMLHFELLKMKDDNDEWYQNRGIMGINENVSYHTITLDVELGRFPGDGFATGMGVIVFGFQDKQNYYVLFITRMDHLMALARFRDGVFETVFPPPDHPTSWENVPTSDPPLLERDTAAAWDWLKVITEDLGNGQTRIQIGVNNRIVIDTTVEGYMGGGIGFGALTYGYSGHSAITKLHVVPWVKYD